MKKKAFNPISRTIPRFAITQKPPPEKFSIAASPVHGKRKINRKFAAAYNPMITHRRISIPTRTSPPFPCVYRPNNTKLPLGVSCSEAIRWNSTSLFFCLLFSEEGDIIMAILGLGLTSVVSRLERTQNVTPSNSKRDSIPPARRSPHPPLLPQKHLRPHW